MTVLNCTSNEIKSLDLSRNTLLAHLSCENNQLDSLNLLNNTKLHSVYLRSNQLNANQLNHLFETLHSNRISAKTIYIGGNPGVAKSDIYIATNKGWKVDVETVEF